MRHPLALPLLAALGLAGALTLAVAQETPAPEPNGRDDMEAGRSLVERGAELFLRGLMDEVGPQLDEMQKGLSEAAKELGPRLTQLMALIDDVKNYEAPERLPNGDIVIRRSPGAPPPPELPGPADPAKKAPEAPAIDL